MCDRKLHSRIFDIPGAVSGGRHWATRACVRAYASSAHVSTKCRGIVRKECVKAGCASARGIRCITQHRIHPTTPAKEKCRHKRGTSTHIPAKPESRRVDGLQWCSKNSGMRLLRQSRT